MPGKNRSKAAFWCGSPAVLRRSAIEDVGGIAVETITEDLHTTLKLINRGYYVAYSSRPAAIGLAPLTLLSYLKQRLRWGQGAMQSLRSRYSPFRIKGLSFGQRINFIASTCTYFDGLQVLVLFSIPAITLLTGVLPIDYEAVPFIARLAPYIFLILGAQIVLGRGYYDLWYTERYSILRSFAFAQSILTLFTGRTSGFTVTPKHENPTAVPSWRLVIPHIIAGTICVIALFAGGINLVEPLWYEQNTGATLIVSGWVIVNLVFIVHSLVRIIRTNKRSSYRRHIQTGIKWRKVGTSSWHDGYTFDLSNEGLSFDAAQPIETGVALETRLSAGASPSSADIRLSVRTVSGREIKGKGTPVFRIGVIVAGFQTNEDANRYTSLIHQPEDLLRNEPQPSFQN